SGQGSTISRSGPTNRRVPAQQAWEPQRATIRAELLGKIQLRTTEGAGSAPCSNEPLRYPVRSLRVTTVLPTVTSEPYCVQIHPVSNDQARDAMDAELIETMSVALKAACVELGLAIKPDAATSRLAQRIVDAARHGVHDPQSLTDAALEGL